uniref:Uncharacterized protein n=1 Tax=Arundo donax TaxID=35708 RepID=A0A0A9FUZ0_ARUDO
MCMYTYYLIANKLISFT